MGLCAQIRTDARVFVRACVHLWLCVRVCARVFVRVRVRASVCVCVFLLRVCVFGVCVFMCACVRARRASYATQDLPMGVLNTTYLIRSISECLEAFDLDAAGA